jgi:hypothetical protein
MKFLMTMITLLITLVGFSQSGKVIDENGEPIPFVTVYSLKHEIGTTTDFDGTFNIDVPLGDSLLFSFMSYKSDTLPFQPNMVVTLNSSTEDINEIVVVAEKIVGSETVLVVDKKESIEVESSIGSTELTKKNISNAEDGLKKVSGVTIKSNKINVRGLGDRYNQVTINKFPLPSNNSDQKNIDLSLIPRTFIGNIKVRKTYTSNQWSNIAGAQIDINTGNIDTNLVVKGGFSYNTNTLDKVGLNTTIGMGKSWDKLSVGFIGRVSTSYQNTDGFTRIIDRQGNIKLDYNYNTSVANRNTFTSLQFNYNPNTRLKFKSISMYVNSSNENTTYLSGTHFDYNNEIFTSRVTPIKSNLIFQQFGGKYTLGKFDVNADLNYSFVSSGEKDRNQFVYLLQGDGFKFNNIDKLDNHHFWSTNLEHRYGGSINTVYTSEKFRTETGYGLVGSKLIFDYRQEYYDMYGVNNEYTYIDTYKPYDYLTETNHTLSEVNNPASRVDGNVLIHAFYNTTNITMGKVIVSPSLRYENIYQDVIYKDQIQPTLDRFQALVGSEFLPSLSLKYEIDDKHQFKFANSRTIIRPRFRELTPFLYTEMFAGSKIQGNPELINSTVYNTDLTYEIYPTRGQVLSFTTFGKLIQSPIERVNVATASGRLETYQNGDMAYVFGGEFESKLKIKDFTIDYNLTAMYSQIKLSDDGAASTIVTNPLRELQGSTPILSNMDLFYKRLGVVYTYTGMKLNSAGIQGIGDVYQRARNQLNIVYRLEKDKFNINFMVANILNSPYTLIQGSDGGTMEINKYRTGLTISSRLTYNF